MVHAGTSTSHAVGRCCRAVRRGRPADKHVPGLRRERLGGVLVGEIDGQGALQHVPEAPLLVVEHDAVVEAERHVRVQLPRPARFTPPASIRGVPGVSRVPTTR